MKTFLKVVALLAMLNTTIASATTATLLESTEVRGVDLPEKVRKTLNEKQLKQLYRYGRYEDEKGQQWNVYFIPGEKYGQDIAIDGVDTAKKLLEAVIDKNFRKEIVSDVKRGFSDAYVYGVKKMYSEGLVYPSKEWYRNLKRDYYYRKAIEDEAYTNRPLGWQATIISQYVRRGFKYVGESIWAVGSGALNLSWYSVSSLYYSVGEGIVVPSLTVLSMPVRAAISGIGGPVVGGIVWVYNNGVYYASTSLDYNHTGKESKYLYIEKYPTPLED